MYNVTEFNDPDKGRAPPPLTVTVCAWDWNTSWSGNVPFSLPSATGSRNMLIPDSHACAETIPTQDRVTTKTEAAHQVCAMNNLAWVLHDWITLRIRGVTYFTHILKQTIYNTLIWIIYIKHISMAYRIYWYNQNNLFTHLHKYTIREHIKLFRSTHHD